MASLLDDIRRAKQKRVSEIDGLLPDTPWLAPEVSGANPAPVSLTPAPTPAPIPLGPDPTLPTVSFKQAFADARDAGLKKFVWARNGKEYTTQTAEEVARESQGTQAVSPSPVEADAPAVLTGDTVGALLRNPKAAEPERAYTVDALRDDFRTSKQIVDDAAAAVPVPKLTKENGFSKAAPELRKMQEEARAATRNQWDTFEPKQDRVARAVDKEMEAQKQIADKRFPKIDPTDPYPETATKSWITIREAQLGFEQPNLDAKDRRDTAIADFRKKHPRTAWDATTDVAKSFTSTVLDMAGGVAKIGVLGDDSPGLAAHAAGSGIAKLANYLNVLGDDKEVASKLFERTFGTPDAKGMTEALARIQRGVVSSRVWGVGDALAGTSGIIRESASPETHATRALMQNAAGFFDSAAATVQNMPDIFGMVAGSMAPTALVARGMMKHSVQRATDEVDEFTTARRTQLMGPALTPEAARAYQVETAREANRLFKQNMDRSIAAAARAAVLTEAGTAGAMSMSRNEQALFDSTQGFSQKSDEYHKFVQDAAPEGLRALQDKVVGGRASTAEMTEYAEIKKQIDRAFAVYYGMETAGMVTGGTAAGSVLTGGIASTQLAKMFTPTAKGGSPAQRAGNAVLLSGKESVEETAQGAAGEHPTNVRMWELTGENGKRPGLAENLGQAAVSGGLGGVSIASATEGARGVSAAAAAVGDWRTNRAASRAQDEATQAWDKAFHPTPPAPSTAAPAAIVPHVGNIVEPKLDNTTDAVLAAAIQTRAAEEAAAEERMFRNVPDAASAPPPPGGAVEPSFSNVPDTALLPQPGGVEPTVDPMLAETPPGESQVPVTGMAAVEAQLAGRGPSFGNVFDAAAVPPQTGGGVEPTLNPMLAGTPTGDASSAPTQPGASRGPSFSNFQDSAASLPRPGGGVEPVVQPEPLPGEVDTGASGTGMAAVEAQLAGRGPSFSNVFDASPVPPHPGGGVEPVVQPEPLPGEVVTLDSFNEADKFYRVIVGDEAFNDIVNSGVVRTNSETKGGDTMAERLARRPTAFPSFSAGRASMRYAAANPNNYIIVTADSSLQVSTKARHGKGSTFFPTDPNGNPLHSLDGNKVKVYRHIGDGNYELVYANGRAVGGETASVPPQTGGVEAQLAQAQPGPEATPAPVTRKPKSAGTPRPTRLTPIEDERLTQEDYRENLPRYVGGAGWVEEGGKLIRNAEGDAVGRTAWVPRADWWQGKPASVTEAILKVAVPKALSGQPMTTAEKNSVKWLLDVMEKDLTAEVSLEGQVIAEELADDLDSFPDLNAVGVTDTAEQMRMLGFTEDEINAEQRRTQAAGEAAEGRATEGDRAGEGQAPQEGTGQTRPELTLAQQTERDILDREAALNQREAEQNKREREALDKEKADRERDDIKRRSEAASETFTLGGDAETNLSGQGDLLSPAAKPATANTEPGESNESDNPDQRVLDQLEAKYAAAAAEPGASAGLKRAAIAYSGITVVAPESVRDTGIPGNLGRGDVAFLQQLGELSGIKFVFVHAPNTGAEQVTFPAVGKTIYVDVSAPASIAAAATAGHETFHIAMHTLRNSANAEDRAVAATVDELLEDNLNGMDLAMYQSYYGPQDTSPARLREEAGADIAGNLHTDPAFWARVLDAVDAKHGATGVRKVIAAMKQALKKLSDLVQGRTFQEGYVTNAIQVREAIAQALTRYYVNHGASAAMAKTKANLALGAKPGKEGDAPSAGSKQPLVLESPKRTLKKGQQHEDTETSTRSQPAAGLRRPEQTGDGRGRDTDRSPSTLEDDPQVRGDGPQVRGATGPDPRLVAVAEGYARSIGIELKRQAEYAPRNDDRSQRLSAAYAAMPHAPNDPVVKEAFENLIRQTTAQYQALVNDGYQFWFIDANADPYEGNPWNAMRDLRANKSMGSFPTESGFGSNVDFDGSENPLAATDTGLTWPSGSLDGPPKRVVANDLFRVVHDAFGHGLEGAGFRAQGEENAWQAHVRLFTGSAVAAITSETRGQNSWLNYGPNGDANQIARVEDTVFADQKTGLMPEWTWTEGRVGDMKRSPRREAARFRRVEPGDSVDGRIVRSDVPNMSSIAASLDDYTVLDGIREVPMSAFDKSYLDSTKPENLDKRTLDLAEQIKASGEINPLIVAIDSEGAYIIEGGHRFDALVVSGARAVPAVVVIDETNPDTLYSRATLQTNFDPSRRRFIMAAAAALATGNVSGGGLTLGRAKPVSEAIMGAQVPSEVASLLRGNGETNPNGSVALKKALNLIASTGPKEVRALAAQIAKLLPDTGFMLTVDDDGLWNANGAVSLGPTNPHLQLFTAEGRSGLTYETVLHEALHVAVASRYVALSSGLIRSNDAVMKVATPGAAKALQQFDDLFSEFRRLVDRDVLSRAPAGSELLSSLKEARRSPDEFFVRALTDPHLQAWMATQKYRGRTLFERFKDWVKEGLFWWSKAEGVAASWLDAALVASQDLNVAMVVDKADFKWLGARILTQKSIRRGGGGDTMFSRVIFEVAPDPNNAALAGEWNRMPQATRREISVSVAETIIPQALKAFGVEGTQHTQVGSYLDDTNTSFALEIDAGGPVGEMTRFFGHVLSQDRMTAMAEQEFTGSKKVGAVTVMLPQDADVAAVYLKLRDIQVDGVQPITGQSTVGGMMAILNYSDVPTLEMARLVNVKLGAEYVVRVHDVFAYSPEKKEYGYASNRPEGSAPARRTPIQGDADILRDEATRLVRDAIDRAGASGIKRSPPRSDAARNERRGARVAGAARGTGAEATQVTGVHYSQQPRDVLDSSRYGEGMPGDEGPRLADWSATPEQRHRIYFYVDEGRGITPESGVGPHPHPAQLNNLYDAKKDPLDLLAAARAKSPAPNLEGNFFEQEVMAAGFDGPYYSNAVNGQGVAVLLGERQIEIKRSPPRRIDPANPDIRRSTRRTPKTPEQLRQDYARLVGQDDPATVSFVDRAMEEAEKDWEAAKRGKVAHEDSDAAAKRLADRLGWSMEAVTAALAQGSIDVNGRAVPAAELLGAGAATARLSVAQLLADPDGPDFSQRMASTINLMIATRANLSEIGRALSYAGWLERKPGVSAKQRTEQALKSLDEATLAADQAVGVTADMSDAEKQVVADYNATMRDLGDARMATEEVQADVDAAQADLTTARDQVRDARGARDAAKKQLSEANAGLKKAEQQRDNAVDRTPGAFVITQAEGAARRAANEAQAAKDWEKLVKERMKSAEDRLARANEMLQKARDNAVDPAELKRVEQKARMAEAEAKLATNALKEAERKLREANKRLRDAQEKEADAKAKTPSAYDISQAQGAARRAEQAADKATAELRVAQRELAKLRAKLSAAIKRKLQQEQRLAGVQQRVAVLRQPQFVGKGGVTMAEIEAAVGGTKGMQRIQRAMRAQGANLDLGQVAQFFQGVANAIYQKKLDATKHRGTSGALHNFMAGWLEQFRALILTGIFTHGVNLISNAAFQAIEMGITRPLAAALPGGLGAANHYKGTTTALLRSVADTYAVLRFGMTQEFPAAHFEALAAARPGTRQDLLDLGGNKWMDQHGGALPGLYGKGMRTVGFSPLGSMDLLFKIVPYRFAIAMQAAQGQPVDYAKAVDMAEYLTFQTTLSEGMSGVQRFVGAWPVLGFIVPFIKTLTNLINRAWDYTPVISQVVNRDNLLGHHGADARNLALAQGVVGLGLALVTLALHGEGDDDDESKLSGLGPLNPNKQALWAANNEKLGLEVGDVVIPLWRVEPFASMMGLTIAAKDAHKLSTESGDYAAAGRTTAAALGQVLVGKSFMKGAEEAMQAALDIEGRGWKYLTERLPQSMVLGATIPNFVSQLGDMGDQYKRDAEGWEQQVKRRVPGWRATLDPKLDYAGRPIREPRFGTALPLQAVPLKDDPTAAWALRNDVPIQAMPKALKTDDKTGTRLPYGVRQMLLQERHADLLAVIDEGIPPTGMNKDTPRATLQAVEKLLKKEARKAAAPAKDKFAKDAAELREQFGIDIPDE